MAAAAIVGVVALVVSSDGWLQATGIDDLEAGVSAEKPLADWFPELAVDDDDEDDVAGVLLSCSDEEPTFEPRNWGLIETGDTSADDSTRAATAAA